MYAFFFILKIYTKEKCGYCDKSLLISIVTLKKEIKKINTPHIIKKVKIYIFLHIRKNYIP